MQNEYQESILEFEESISEYQENRSESESEDKEKYHYFRKSPQKHSSFLFLYIFWGIFTLLIILILKINSSYLYCFHIIKENDTLISISKKYYGTSYAYEKIFAANVSILKNKDTLPVGKVIRIPLPKITSKYVYIPHKVVVGDTIDTLSQRYYGSSNNVSKIIVANLNILKKTAKLPIGKIIRIPMLKLSSDYLYLPHRIVKNDSIQRISLRYFGNIEQEINILVANSKKIKNIDSLPIGSIIRIPILKKNDYHYEPYKVMPNDTILKISEKYYKTPNEWAKIFVVNFQQLKKQKSLIAGQILYIPIAKK